MPDEDTITASGGFSTNTVTMLVEPRLIPGYEPTPEEAEQWAREAAEWRAKRGPEWRLAWATYDAALEQLAALDDAAVRAVLALHAPLEEFGDVRCHGCDDDGRTDDYPLWPCRTIVAIGQVHDIDLPETNDLAMTPDPVTHSYRRLP